MPFTPYIIVGLCSIVGGILAIVLANAQDDVERQLMLILGILAGAVCGGLVDLRLATAATAAEDASLRLEQSRAEVDADDYRWIRAMRGTSPEVDRAIDRAMADGRITNSERDAISSLIGEEDLDRQRCLTAGTCDAPATTGRTRRTPVAGAGQAPASCPLRGDRPASGTCVAAR